MQLQAATQQTAAAAAAASSVSPTAAGVTPPTAAAAAEQLSNNSSGIDGSTNDIGLPARVQDKLLEFSGRVMGFLWGHSGTRNLLSLSTEQAVSTPPYADAAPAAAAAAAGAAAGVDTSVIGSSATGYQNLPAGTFQQQQQQRDAARRLAAADNQQQQQQQGAARRLTAAGSNLPMDPELDPRGLLSDVALLDESDVLVGLHGAQLFNALYMPAHKALVEVRPYQFTGVSGVSMVVG
jgi:hypothetical protein